MLATKLLATLAGAGFLVATSVTGAVMWGPSLVATTPAASAANGTSGNPGHPITVTGAVTGTIAPGRPATLTVTIINPNNQDLVITSVTGAITLVTTAGIVGRPPCNAAWYHVGTSTAATPIKKNKSAVVSVPISLDNRFDTNQDNCKGATVRFSFAAQAQLP